MATIRSLEELRAQGVLRELDEVVFSVGTEEILYRVHDSYIGIDGVFNRFIFEKLRLDKAEFCSKAYGYVAGSGSCPEAHHRDFPALTRLVEALYLEIARQAGENPETPAPAKRRTPGQQALISSVADVDAYAPLQEGDRVFFQSPQGEMSLKVDRDGDGWLCHVGCSEPGHTSDAFTRLGVRDSNRARAEKATEIVGKEPDYNWTWPQYKDVADFQKLLKGLLTAYGQIGEAVQAEPELKEGDEIEFTVRGETARFKVEESSEYSTAGQGFYGFPIPLREELRGKVFTMLGLHGGKFIEEVTGVHCNDFSDPWPSIPSLADFNKVVCALRERCAAANAQVQQPQKADTPDGPRVITTVEELRAAGTPRRNDRVVISGASLEVIKELDGWWLSGSAQRGGNNFAVLERVAQAPTDEERFEYIRSVVGYAPTRGYFAKVRTAEDLAKVIEDLMIRAGQKAPFTRTPGKPVRVTTVEELEAVAPLQVGDEFVVPAGGETFVVTVRRCDSGRFFGRIGGGSRDSELFSLLAIHAADFIENIIGQKPYHAALAWPDVPTLEDMTKLAKALMTHEVNSKRPELAASEYVEGAVIQDEDGSYRRILNVRAKGSEFFLSDDWPTLEGLDDDSVPELGGIEVTLEELKREYTLVATSPTPAPTEEPIFAEDDLVYDPENNEYARVLAASKDGRVLVLSNWTGGPSNEGQLSSPSNSVWSSEELREAQWKRVDPASLKPTLVKRTRLQIAEKFGVSVEQLQIEDEAA